MTREEKGVAMVTIGYSRGSKGRIAGRKWTLECNNEGKVFVP